MDHVTKFKLLKGDWVIVLDGCKALFLQNLGNEANLSLAAREVRDQPDPPNRELYTDRPGKVHQSATSGRSAVELVDRHDAAERAFVEGVAARLAQLAGSDNKARFTIVAPPRALGMIRKVYTPALKPALNVELAHDWVHLPVAQIESRPIDIAKTGTGA